MSEMFVGRGKFFMASRYFGSGFTSSSVKRKPENSTTGSQNWISFGFMMILLLLISVI